MISAFLQPVVEVCETNLLEPKWLLAPSRRVGIQWKDQINLGGVNTVNLHAHTIQSAVLGLVSGELAARKLEFVSGVRFSLLIGELLAEMQEAKRLAYLNQVKMSESLSQLVARTVADVRLAALSPQDLVVDAFESDGKAADIAGIMRAYEAKLAELSLADYAYCLQLASQLVEDGSAELPESLLVISPLQLAVTRLERDFFEQLGAKRKLVVPTAKGSEEDVEFSAVFTHANGEVNEVQLMLREVLSAEQPIRIDQVEVLHADYTTYVPLVYESLTAMLGEQVHTVEDLPVTFGEGLSCIYSRPGRALRSWLRWIRHGCLQSTLVQIIREGLLDLDIEVDSEASKDRATISFVQLSHRLRELPIGLGRDRYRAQLVAAIEYSKAQLELFKMRAEDPETHEFSKDYDFGLATYERLLSIITGVLDISPESTDTPSRILEGAKNFLVRYARTTSKLDEYAKERLLDDIAAIEEAISISVTAVVDVWDWLEQLPVESRILASGPRPGCVHVDHICRGGHSGRNNTYIMGLDDSRFPHRGGQDPLLLDFERKRLSNDLQTSSDISARVSGEYSELLGRLRGNVTFSYATYSLAADHVQFPSSTLLETFRIAHEEPTATLDEFNTHLGMPISYCPSEDDGLITADQWWQATLASEKDESKRTARLEQGFQHFEQGRVASEQRASEWFTQYDGHVPAAGIDLDPTAVEARRVSPSRLETFGVCPRKFFFRYGLGISPPDEHEIDNEKWLDALALGSLLHEVFEDFLRQLTSQNRIPEFATDHELILKLLNEKIEHFKQTIPIPNEDAFRRQYQHLQKTCETFLRLEEKHCRETGAMPFVFEASIGLGDDPRSVVDVEEPVQLTLSDGRTIRVGGRIDRIDQLGGQDSLEFAIWDYKSGSAWGFDQADPFKQGRKLQPFLYAGMLKHRLSEAVDPKAKVNYFGYFFPSPKTEGLRLQWTTGELKSGDEVLRHICDAISAGTFVSTNDKSDCNFCDYQSICGSPADIAASSLVLLESTRDAALDPIRNLRNVRLVEFGGEQ